MNTMRRSLLKALGFGGVFGGVTALPVASGGESVMVFYVNVGKLSSARAEALVERLKRNFGPASSGWLFHWMPVREGESRVEVFHAGRPKEVTLLVEEGLS